MRCSTTQCSEEVPGGEHLTEFTGVYPGSTVTDKQVSYQLVRAVKRGRSPVRAAGDKVWQGSPQPVARVHGGPKSMDLTGKETQHPEILVKYCLQGCTSNSYYDIKVHPQTRGRPQAILTQLRVMRSQPKKVQTAVTFYVGDRSRVSHTWFECVLLC
ncbi:hypothetical protein GWK47_015977 [Chionoecetes opilio]|uniref:Uncharacterized protein n=1 Tax=Chionoecetes opilio TaxID=41210 RepID=A0A8J4XWU6_CHIOP|nr:hypothetical protein GWK47_015977 [Chionoecetes opilio]